MRSVSVTCGLAIIAVLAAGCSAEKPAPSSSSGSEQGGAAGPDTHAVVYEVTGPGTSPAITLVDVDKPVTENNVPLPWKKEVSAKRGTILSVMAAPDFNLEGADKTVTCTITVDGKEVDTQSDEVLASCLYELT
ncbi:MAG TPA: MmpS family transport accessory protein [Actinophytocola sp.]|uniref:MmpS family transport accessory protein n=1 Tax=Actinophytocola sp. TaxID=1872138 RepID=UPI002DB7C86B|nr:MmpS family transport accessory protein [Actinophytocola sp.]HEU5470112.1 MmpS family transport accessory protein [Actinophytocola sp.]